MDEPELIRQYERRYGPFTHMAPGDKAIWVRYLIQGGNQYAPFNYDLRVGDGTQLGPVATDEARTIAYAITTKRIDALAVVNGTIRIIEVKQRAGLSAVGQLIGYRDLYIKTFQPPMPVDMWLVTDELQPDMQHVLTENNIHWWVTAY